MDECNLDQTLLQNRAGKIKTADPFADCDIEIFEARIQGLLCTPEGRRQLRNSPFLDSRLANQLLEYEADYAGIARDASLANVVEAASISSLRQHTAALAAGSSAPHFWMKLRSTGQLLVPIAEQILASSDAQASQSTLYLLLLDQVNPFDLDTGMRTQIATAALASEDPLTRGLAAEYLAEFNPESLTSRLFTLVNDGDERVRGFTWRAGYQTDPAATVEVALDILSPVRAPTEIQRSALLGAAEHLPTAGISEILAYFVMHPDRGLAIDAAQLMFRLHRHPDIAYAAITSPHEEVREIAATLLDPFRGSPAAGGSRPDSPTSIDLVIDMMRQADVEVPELPDIDLIK